jgi:hypothetical protein
MRLTDLPNIIDEFADANYIIKAFIIITFIIGVVGIVGGLKYALNKIHK